MSETPGKVLYWDAESLGMVQTEDSYVDVITGTTLRVHEPSGLVVHDVAAFEKWLRQVRTT